MVRTCWAKDVCQVPEQPRRGILSRTVRPAIITSWRSTPSSQFSAFAILFAVPPAIVYFIVQRWITSGLAIGGVKG